MEKVIFKSAKLVNNGLWTSEIELFKVYAKKDDKTYVLIRRTFDRDHITRERIEAFSDFTKAYNFFHDLLKDWL